jgi:SHS2 domain-containing protein
VTYRWVEHTAELELAIEASTEEDVYRDAVSAFAELLADGETNGQTREVALRANERAARLVELLEELVFLADTAAFVPEELAELDLGDGRAVVAGHRGSPPPLVKAVTYHGLAFEQDDGWKARLVLDV